MLRFVKVKLKTFVGKLDFLLYNICEKSKFFAY